VCIRGARTDGHEHYAAAKAGGAICALAERDPGCEPYILVGSTLAALRELGGYYRGLFDIPIIGVTGSVGKTTAKEMIASALGARFNVHKTPMNLNNEIGVPLTLLAMGEEHDAAVIEMGISDFGEMGRLAAMARPTHCVMTAIGHSHLETLGDLDGVLRAKSEVFGHMPPDGVAIVNGDDELLRGLDPGMRKITFGLGAGNDYAADNVEPRGPDGLSFDITGGGGRFHASVPAYGEHLALAALPGAIIGELLGMTGAEIAKGLAAFSPVAGRANITETERITVIDDCYNANPDSVRAALASLRALPGRHVAILGDMNELGPRSEELHRETGVEAARAGLDSLICCGERSQSTLEGYIEAGGRNGRHFPSKQALTECLSELIVQGDTVLVKASHSHGFDEIVKTLLLQYS
jgi:UDP-N-acetylmuramoyl-tripeptide--D-alanyl-D-alanine ligase